MPSVHGYPMRNFQEIATKFKSDSGRLGFLPTAYAQQPTCFQREIYSVGGFRKSARLAQGPPTIPLILKVQFSETVRD